MCLSLRLYSSFITSRQGHYLDLNWSTLNGNPEMIFEKVNFVNIQEVTKKHENLPSELVINYP